MTTSASPQTLIARTPEDLLAMVPLVLGFVPSDSVVMLTFEGHHTFHARVDLPVTGAEVTEVVASLLEPATRHGVGVVVLIFHTGQVAAADRAWRGLRHGCEREGIAVVEALRTDGTRWFGLRGDPRRDPCREGVPYDLTSHRFVAEAVLQGRVTLRSRAELAAGLVPRPDEVARVQAALDVLPDRELPDASWVDDVVRRGLDCGPAAPLPDADVAGLVRALRVVEVRDEVVAALTGEKSGAHVAFWTDVLTRTPGPDVPPVATLLGLAAWLSGDGALAWCAIDRCVDIDPDYTLMNLLGTALTRAVPPSLWDGVA